MPTEEPPEWSGRERAARVLLVAGVVASCTPFVTPPIALLAGLLVALVLGNPFIATTSRFSKHLLKASVIGLGFGIPLSVVVDAGLGSVLEITVGVVGVAVVGLAVGAVLGVEAATSALVTIGTAICGGSAIAALGPAIRARAEPMAVALGTVFVLNSIALYLFPPIGAWAGLSQEGFGTWAAIAIHDTASVVGAASVYGTAALETATVLKLVRTLWIVPLVALGAAWAARRLEPTETTRRRYWVAAFPWFILGFLAAASTRTLIPAWAESFDLLRDVARQGLVVTLFLIGAGLTRESLRRVGWRPLLQGLVLWGFVSCVALLWALRQG